MPKNIKMKYKENYEPTLKEVRSEVINDIYKGCKAFSECLFIGTITPYILPRFFRAKEPVKDKESVEDESDVSLLGWTGFGIGIVSQASLLYACCTVMSPYLLIPVATNVAGVGYEKCISTKNRMSKEYKAKMVDKIKN